MKKYSVTFMVLLLSCLIYMTGCQQTAVTSAKVYMQQNNYDKAIEQCKLAITQVQNNTDAYFILGLAYGEKGLYREMIDAFNTSLQISPKYSVQVQEFKSKYFAQAFNSGVALIKQNQYEQAAENYKTCIEIFPKKIESYINLGYIYTLMKNDSAAIEINKKAILADSSNLEVHTSLGMLYYRTKQYEKAIDAFKPVIKVSKPDSKNYLDGLYCTALSYDLLQQTDKAIETYNNALKVTPDNKDIIFNLGRLYTIKGDKAMNQYNDATLKISKSGKDSLLNMGRVYYQNAMDQFQTVVAVEPNDFEANFNIGYALSKQNKFEEAIPYLKKSYEMKPDNSSAWVNYVSTIEKAEKKDAEYYFVMGKGIMQFQKVKDAIPYLQNSLALNPNNAAVLESLIIAYEKSGFTKEAAEARKKANALKSSN